MAKYVCESCGEVVAEEDAGDAGGGDLGHWYVPPFGTDYYLPASGGPCGPLKALVNDGAETPEGEAKWPECES